MEIKKKKNDLEKKHFDLYRVCLKRYRKKQMLVIACNGKNQPSSAT